MEKNGNKSIGKLNLIAAIIAIAIVIFRLVYIQFFDLIEHKNYSDPIISTSLVRGTIYDRNGNILAIQAPSYGFKLDIKYTTSSYIASVIAPHTNMSSLQITDEINKGTRFFPLKEVPDASKLSYLERMMANFSLEDEITIIRIEERKYPSGRYVSDIVGMVDSYMDGISGIELKLNQSLKATPRLGQLHVQGANAVLTIDQSLQFAINSIDRLARDHAEAAILNKNGELLAFYGTVTDDILSNCVLSTSSSDSYLVFTPTFPTKSMKEDSFLLGEDNPYYIWVQADNDDMKRTILQSLEDILRQEGRI